MFKNNKKGGYAILFTMVIVSAVSLIAAGLSSTSYKQLILSSLVKDSQTAFYKADTASECALYSYFVKKSDMMIDGNNFTCGKDGNGDLALKVSNASFSPNYNLTPAVEDTTDPCFRINITEVVGATKTNLNMKSKGYNICDINNRRSVEREIEVKFEFDNN